MSQERILIVSDELTLRRALRITLMAKGYTVTDVGAREAASEAPKQRPDLVLIDMDNSEDMGFDICRQVRTVSNAGVVIMSGTSTEESEARLLASGAHDCISKPFSLSQITNCLDANMSRHSLVSCPA